MAKINKDEQLRREGMAYAYKVAKEKGIEGLEQELKFRNITKVPIGLDKKYLKEFVNNVKRTLYAAVKVVALLTLHDEFGFGNKRLIQFNNRFETKADSIFCGYASFQDFADCLQEECGIDIYLDPNEEDVTISSRVIGGLGGD